MFLRHSEHDPKKGFNMFTNTNFETRNNCANKLRALHKEGISVIPLQGKRPRTDIRWKQYQSELPSKNVLESWAEQAINSYGIICGRISNGIIVIDFDCPNLYNQFTKQFKKLTNTYTVKTKRGYHLYFKTTFALSSRHFDKCDIKGDGGYIVGEGSIIDGYQYKVSKQIQIRSLTYKNYKSIIQWLAPVPKQKELPFLQPLNNDNLVNQYLALAPNIGRNNALYTVACQARKQYISQEETVKLLASQYVTTLANSLHKSETPAQRLNEAINTIKSAYQSSTFIPAESKSLPNSIREKLLQVQKSTIASRLLDVIKLKKIEKSWITLAELVKIGQKIHISKRSILKVLTGNLSKVSGHRLFKQIPYQDYITSYVSQGDKRKPNSKVGRPTQYIYQIPNNKYLCNILRVDKSLSDALRLQDLFSAGAYRRALHRELIVRLSPIIRVDWYANRLGVHRRTIFRYNLQLGVITTPTVIKDMLTIETIKILSDNDSSEIKGFTPGKWLETLSGKRYPALKSIAHNLINKLKAPVKYCKQLPSRYTLYRNRVGDAFSINLPDHLKSRSKRLNRSNIHEILSPDWATKKFDLGGYLAVYNGYEWTFRPPFRAIAYQLMKQYEEGLVYFIKPLKT